MLDFQESMKERKSGDSPCHSRQIGVVKRCVLLRRRSGGVRVAAVQFPKGVSGQPRLSHPQQSLALHPQQVMFSESKQALPSPPHETGKDPPAQEALREPEMDFSLA